MPRGVKKSTADKLRQELEKIRKSISDHEEKIAALKEKEKERLPAEERTGLFRNIRAMMMHKLGTVVVNNTHDAEMESIRQTMEEKGLDVDALKKILDCYEADCSKDEAN